MPLDEFRGGEYHLDLESGDVMSAEPPKLAPRPLQQDGGLNTIITNDKMTGSQESMVQKGGVLKTVEIVSTFDEHLLFCMWC